jgi:hypothetical protein
MIMLRRLATSHLRCCDLNLVVAAEARRTNMRADSMGNEKRARRLQL